jgi:predicted metal-dependent enzyme (double-stranded beta helix superfamily)
MNTPSGASRGLHQEFHQELKSICETWSDTIQSLSDPAARFEYIREKLPDLLLNQALFGEILKNIKNGAGYPDIRQSTMFDNELLLYTDGKRAFSIRMYLWGPGDYTPVHDHNSWGIIGPVSGNFEVIKYVRQDDGSREDRATLYEEGRFLLSPGQTDLALPLNKGIHRTGNPTDITTITLHLYGTPLRRSFINIFDPDSGKVSRIYAPKAKKKMLASDALRGLGL